MEIFVYVIFVCLGFCYGNVVFKKSSFTCIITTWKFLQAIYELIIRTLNDEKLTHILYDTKKVLQSAAWCRTTKLNI